MVFGCVHRLADDRSAWGPLSARMLLIRWGPSQTLFLPSLLVHCAAMPLHHSFYIFINCVLHLMQLSHGCFLRNEAHIHTHMLARTVARLWTPRYFTRQVGVGRRLSKRRVRSLNTPDASCSTEAVKGEVTETPRTAPTCASQLRKLHGGSPPESAPPKPFAVLRSSQRRISVPQPTPSAPVRTENPLVQCAQKLLHQLSSTDHPQTSSPLGSSRGYAEFSARRDVFGPLRGLLPPHPATLSSGSAAKPASRHRFRVVPVMNGNLLATPPPPQTNTTTDFSLAELTLFLRLYDSADVEDGQLLLQIMNEIRRHLFALAETGVDGEASSTCSVASNTTGEGNLEAGIGVGVEIMSQEPSAAPLPLPGMLYTMASLGIAEEAILEVVIKCTMRNGKPSRSGLLYPQLRFYPVKELLQLLVALQRFGHQQHFSAKAVVKMLRASFYNTRTVAGRFHKHVRALKKALAARPGTPPSREGRCSVASTDADAGGVAAMTLADEELCSLAFMLECPLFLLLEALTTATTTVHRREDVVTFLSDLISVTAVVELTTAVHEHRGWQGATSREELSQETQEFVFAVSYQLLRAAKLAESMEVPQLLLSDVFSWSTTLSGRGVVVDGDEDNAVPSDRVAYYDHVTADLIKLNRNVQLLPLDSGMQKGAQEMLLSAGSPTPVDTWFSVESSVAFALREQMTSNCVELVDRTRCSWS